MKFHSISITLLVTLFRFHLSHSIVQIQYAVLDDFYKSSAVQGDDTSVVTNDHLAGQNLGGWELYVLNDLFFQIAMKKCPKVNRPTASFLINFISQSLKTVPPVQSQHPEFLPTYAKLMDCYDYLDLISKNPGKKLDNSVVFITKDKKINLRQGQDNFDIGIIQKEKANTDDVITHVHPQLNHAWEDQEGTWHFQWINKVSDMISSLFRRKRSSETLIVQTPQPKDIRKDSQAKHKFSQLLHDVSRIARISCPTEFKPSSQFSKIVSKDLVSWVSQDAHGLTATVLKYFRNNSILDEINECLKAL